MSSFARRLRRSQSGRRASVASVIAIFVIGLFAVAPVAAVPAVPGPGYQDFQYNAGPESAPGGDAVTGSRNQSKLWFHDGKWWGMLFDKTTARRRRYRIQSLNMATQTWTTGGTAPQVDKRNKSHGDVLSDGNNLWVVSSHNVGHEHLAERRPPRLQVQLQRRTHKYAPVGPGHRHARTTSRSWPAAEPMPRRSLRRRTGGSGSPTPRDDPITCDDLPCQGRLVDRCNRRQRCGMRP